MMKDFTISNMLDLGETIAAELLRERPIRGKFFRRSEILSLNWEKLLIRLSMRKKARISGSQNQLLLHRQQASQVRRSSVKTLRCATVRLSAARPLLARAQ